MRRDMDLVKEILLAMEQKTVWGKENMEIPEYTDEQISYHLMLMHNAGLIEAIDFSSHDFQIAWKPHRLTMEGHEFLDNARNETAWEKMKAYLKDKGGSASFDVIKGLLTKFIIDGLK